LFFFFWGGGGGPVCIFEISLSIKGITTANQVF